MKTLNIKRHNTEIVHLSEAKSEFILSLNLPSEFKFYKHIDEPIAELSEKKIVVIQKVLRDANNLNFKFKLNSEPGRVDLFFQFSAILNQTETKVFTNFEINIPVLVTTEGQKNTHIFINPVF